MSEELIDTHCHLASAQFAGEVGELIQRAQVVGVGQMLTLGTDPEDWQENLKLSRHESRAVLCALGVHPCSVAEVADLDETMQQLEVLAREQRVVAIGETGLDYYHPAPEGWDEQSYHRRQQQFLRAHFELAKQLGKPIVLHSRDRKRRQSVRDALSIAREFRGQVRAQFHCYLGPWDELATEILEMEGMLSFGGIATFPSARETTFAAAIEAPRGSFCLETDAPYLAPVPHRGKRNEPAFVKPIAEHLASARNESLQELAAHTTKTAREFFGLSSLAPSP